MAKAQKRTRARQAASRNEPSGPDLSQISARKNLNELAFFFPHLTTDKDGTVRMEFTMPEALDEVEVHGLRARQGTAQRLSARRSRDCQGIDGRSRTRRGSCAKRDVIEFSVKVTNQSQRQQTGKVRLDTQPIFAASSRSTHRSAIAEADQAFDLEPGTSRSFYWTTARARWPGADHVQGGWRQRQALRRRRGHAAGVCRAECW